MAITRTRDEDGVATLTIDDGKANALDLDVFAELDARLDDCADDAAVVVTGRPGVFCAGLDTKALAAADDAGIAALLTAFGRTTLRLWLEPRPVVAAVTGHAIAGGTILAMACDHAVAAEGDFRWGLTETTIGFPMPGFVLAVARGTVRTDRLDDLVLSGALVPAEEAVAVGYADALVEPDAVVAAATARARELSALPPAAYAATKRRLRGRAAAAELEVLDDDVAALLRERDRR